MGVPLYGSSAVCDRSRRPGSARSRPEGAGDENAHPADTAQRAQHAVNVVRKNRPVSARPRLMTTGPQQPRSGPALAAEPPSSKHPRSKRRPASARPASARPASALRMNARVTGARPASAATTATQLSDQPGGTRQWKSTYRPMTASGCSVKEPWATMVPASRLSSAQSRPSHPATARVDCGQRPANGRDPHEVADSLEREVAALVRIVALERERAAVRRAPGAPPDLTSLACYSRVFLRLIDRCVALRPLLSRIKDAYDDTINGQVRQLQEGATKITRSKTGVDRIAGLDSLGVLATSENPSDGRFAAETTALQSALGLARRRADAARATAASKRRGLKAKRTELEGLKHSVDTLKETVEALGSTQNRIVASLKKLQDRRMGDDLHKTSGYWLKRKSADTTVQTTEMRAQIRREQVDRLNVDDNLDHLNMIKKQLEQQCENVLVEIKQWRLETADIQKRTMRTEESFKDFRRSVGPGTPRPEWEQVEKHLMHGFGGHVQVQGNDELAQYRRMYGTNPLHIDVNQKSSTLAMQIAGHVSELRVHLVDTQQQLKDAEALATKKKEDEVQMQAVIEAEQAAVAESYRAKKFFILQGTGPNVPIYMRGTGKVRDVAMPKAEAEEIIKNIWDTKIRSDSRKGAKKLELDVFVAGWMKTTYGVRALEKTYNLVDALKRFEYDADCALFYLVLKGELCEDVYIQESRMIDAFMRALVAEARKWSNDGKLNKKLRRPEFLKTLESHFARKKTHDELYALKRALAYDQPTAYITYAELLEENERADQGQFAEELRDQFLLSVQQSYVAVEQSIREATIQRAAENGRIIQSDGPPRIAAHRIVFNEAPCTQQCDTLMKEALLSECPLCEYNRDDMIIVQGGSGTAMYLIIKGSAVAEKNGHQKLIEYGPGQIFGELSALSARGKPVCDAPSRQATVIAQTDMLVMVLDAAQASLRRDEAVACGDTERADRCGHTLRAIDSVLGVQVATQTTILESYRCAEKLAELKRVAKVQEADASDQTAPDSKHGLWTTVANCWRGCMDYIGPDDPDYDYETAAEEARLQAEGDAADAEVSRAVKRLTTNRDDPVPAEKRARPLVLAGLGEDATPGWEIAEGGLSSTKRVWLPDFVRRLRSIFIPLPRPEWLTEQANKGK